MPACVPEREREREREREEAMSKVEVEGSQIDMGYLLYDDA